MAVCGSFQRDAGRAGMCAYMVSCGPFQSVAGPGRASMRAYIVTYVIYIVPNSVPPGGSACELMRPPMAPRAPGTPPGGPACDIWLLKIPVGMLPGGPA